MAIIKARGIYLPLLTGFLLVTALAGNARSDPCYYLVRKTYTVQNGTVSSGKTEIFLLDRIKTFGKLAFKPVVLQGQAFLTLPSEKREATQEAIDHAFASYAPASREAWVMSATVTGTGRPAASTRVVTFFLFTSPTPPLSVTVRSNTLRVSFKSAVSQVDPRFFPPLTSKTEHLFFAEFEQLYQDFAHRILALCPFQPRKDSQP